MAKRIGVLAAEQAATDSPQFFEKKSIVRSWIRSMEAVWIVPGQLAQKLRVRARRGMAMIGRGLVDGPIGIGNVLPFARLHNYGDKLHYEMPMAGDRGCFARHRPRNIRVSSRSLFSKQILPAVAIAG